MRKLFFLAAITGCATAGTKQPETNEAAALVAAEYSVYSHLMSDNRDFAVADSTVSMTPVTCAEDVPSRCWAYRAGVSTEAWNDHSRKNVARSELQPLFDPALGIRLQRQTSPVEPSCTEPKIVRFTRPGFNKDRSQAVIWMTYERGSGPFPGCGFVSSTLFLLNRVKGGWASPKSLIVGIS